MKKNVVIIGIFVLLIVFLGFKIKTINSKDNNSFMQSLIAEINKIEEEVTTNDQGKSNYKQVFIKHAHEHIREFEKAFNNNELKIAFLEANLIASFYKAGGDEGNYNFWKSKTEKSFNDYMMDIDIDFDKYFECYQNPTRGN